MATTDQWRTIEGWAEHLTGVRRRASSTAACLLDLRRRVEALEQRAAAPAADQRRLNNPVQIAECGGPCSEGGPAACDCGALAEPAPVADRPLWRQMHLAYYEVSDTPEDWAAVLDAVAEWLDARGYGWDAVAALHTEARRAMEGA